MKENTCNYSDEFQPYKMSYDKFEYDIKLKDGTIVENCYPNAGKFNSLSNEYDGKQFKENEVDEIRFTHNPKMGINGKVSNINQDIEKDKALTITKRHLDKFGLTPKSRKEERLWLKIKDYMNGKYTLNDVKQQIENKMCPLPRSQRDFIMEQFKK